MGQLVVIAVIDDIVRAGLYKIFAEDARVSDVYEVTNNEHLQKYLDSSIINFVMIDQSLETDLTILPKGNFAVLAMEPHLPYLQSAYQNGGCGYFSVLASKELLQILLSPKRGTFLIDPVFAAWMIPLISNTTQSDAENIGLTERQKQVDSLARMGMSKSAIAEHLCIAHSTVKTHFKQITKKRCEAQQVNGAT